MTKFNFDAIPEELTPQRRGSENRDTILALLEQASRPITLKEINTVLAANDIEIKESTVQNNVGILQKDGLVVKGAGHTYFVAGADFEAAAEDEGEDPDMADAEEEEEEVDPLDDL